MMELELHLMLVVDCLDLELVVQEKVRVTSDGDVNITGITTANQLFEGTNRVATASKAFAMALVFG